MAGLGRFLKRGFFAASAPEVAPQLIGCVLSLPHARGALQGMILETEAYTEDDPASHSFCGPTERNRAMFMAAGTIYVYRSYGIHFCMNIVTGAEGVGEAVLIRGLLPLEGKAVMMKRRKLTAQQEARIADGPGKLTQALGIDLSWNQRDLSEDGSGMGIARYRQLPWQATERIGISKAKDVKWRFVATKPYL